MTPLIDRLLVSEEPSIRFKVRVRILCEDTDSHSVKALRKEIAQSQRVEALLSDRDEEGRICPARHPYKKWTGAHWVLATLGDIGYPPGNKTIEPIRNQVFDYWLAPYHLKEEPYDEAPPRHREKGVPVICGRARRCASQQGNALFSAVRLGLMDERCDILAGLLLKWQWEDGGWPAEERFYNTDPSKSNAERVSWGGVNKKHMNEWVTADALYVLKSAGR